MRRDASKEVGVPVADAADGQIDLAGLAHALWRRKYWIVLPALAAGVAAAIYVSVATPLYRSNSLVVIENRETAYYRLEGDRTIDAPRPDPEAVQSEVQLALSQDLAREVVREMKLAERPEFNPAAGTSMIGGLLRLVGLARDSSRMTRDEQVLERYYDRLAVFQMEKSRVIAIEFVSENAVLAAEVANSVARHLLEFQRRAKQEAMRQASQWLAREIDELRSRVNEAEARAEEFRGKSNLYVGSNNTTLSAQQLAELNTQFMAARGQRAEAESKARLIREMLRTGRPIEATDVVNSELIRRLNEQRVTLQAQLAEQSSTLLGQHPRIKELKAQIADLEARTRTEAAQLARSLDNDVEIIGARVESLSATLDQVKKQASALGVEDVRLRALEREAKSQRDLLESYLARYRDVTAREGPDAVQPDARVVSQAVPSPTPYFPKKVPVVLIVMLATAMSAATLVALAELLRGAHYRPLSRMTAQDLPEELPSAAPSWIGPGQKAVPHRPEPSAEAQGRQMAALAAHVKALGRGVVVVSPAEAGEPYSEVAVQLARELARGGARPMLLDVDVAGKRVSSLAGDPRVPGLADLLFGVATFGEVIQRERASRVHVIPIGRGIRDTAALLEGQRLAIVLGALSQTYDCVIVAAPALGQIPAAARLARFTRGVLVVTSDGREGAGASAADMLAAHGFRNVAVVSIAPDEVPPERAPDRAAA